MKKLVLLFLFVQFLTANASELTEDYLDIAANYCTYGDYQKAIEYIDKVIQAEPNNYDAIELKNTILRINNPNSKSYLNSKNKNIQQAQNYKMQGNKNKQINTLASCQNDFWANFILAETYYENSDYVNAINYYKKAESITPSYSQTYLNLAQCYSAIKDWQNSLAYLNKYLSYNKNSDIAYAMRAEVNLNLSNLKEAENDIKKALKIEDNLSYRLIEAKILYYKGDYEDSRKKFISLSKNIQTSEVYKYIGLCDYALCSYANALLNLDKAMILSNEDKTLNQTYNHIKILLENK